MLTPLILVLIANAENYTVNKEVDYVTVKGDLVSRGATDRATCEDLCNKNSRCLAYTVSDKDQIYPNMCWLKSQLVNRTDSPIRTTYIKVNTTVPDSQPTVIMPIITQITPSPSLVVPSPLQSIASEPSPLVVDDSLSTPNPLTPLVSPTENSLPTRLPTSNFTVDGTKPQLADHSDKSRVTPATTTFRPYDSGSKTSSSSNTITYIFAIVGIIIGFACGIFIIKFRCQKSKSFLFNATSSKINSLDHISSIDNESIISQSQTNTSQDTIYWYNNTQTLFPNFETPSSILVPSVKSSSLFNLPSFQDRTTVSQSECGRNSGISEIQQSYSSDIDSCSSSYAFLESAYTIKNVMIRSCKSIVTSIYKSSDNVNYF